jgi:hypothetical protein
MPKTRAHRKKRGGDYGNYQSPPATLTNVGNSAYQTTQRVGQGLSGAWSGITNWFSNLVRPNNSTYGQPSSGYGQSSSGYGQPSSGFGYGGRRKKTRKARKY